jgi:hypothetical protein
LYFDVTNALLTKNQNLPTYIFERDEKTFGIKTTDGKALLPDGSNGIPKVVEDKSLFVLPSLGFIFEF